MNPMVKMKVQRAAGIQIKGYIGLEDGKPFIKIGVYFDNGRWLTEGSFSHIYREARRRAGRHQWKSSEYVGVTTETDENGQVAFHCSLVPPTDSRHSGDRIRFTIPADAVEEINRLLRAVEHNMDLYSLELVRSDAAASGEGDVSDTELDEDEPDGEEEEVLEDEDIEIVVDDDEVSEDRQLLAAGQSA